MEIATVSKTENNVSLMEEKKCILCVNFSKIYKDTLVIIDDIQHIEIEYQENLQEKITESIKNIMSRYNYKFNIVITSIMTIEGINNTELYKKQNFQIVQVLNSDMQEQNFCIYQNDKKEETYTKYDLQKLIRQHMFKKMINSRFPPE